MSSNIFRQRSSSTVINGKARVRYDFKTKTATVVFRFIGLEFTLFASPEMSWSFYTNKNAEIKYAFPPMHPQNGACFPKLSILDALKLFKQHILYIRSVCPPPEYVLTSDQYQARANTLASKSAGTE